MQPSARYHEIVAACRVMHEAPDKHTGRLLTEYLPAITGLARSVDARTLLDYGCGKAVVHQRGPLLEGVETTLYDPGHLPFAERPAGKFDLVICTDVLEHVPEADVDWVLRDIAGFAGRAVLLGISCMPSEACLPNGENEHVTVHPPDWWLPRVALAMGGLRWIAFFAERHRTTESRDGGPLHVLTLRRWREC